LGIGRGNEDLCGPHSSPNIIQAVTLTRMTLAGHVVGIGRGNKGFWWGNLMKRDQQEDLNLDGRII